MKALSMRELIYLCSFIYKEKLRKKNSEIVEEKK